MLARVVGFSGRSPFSFPSLGRSRPKKLSDQNIAHPANVSGDGIGVVAGVDRMGDHGSVLGDVPGRGHFFAALGAGRPAPLSTEGIIGAGSDPSGGTKGDSPNRLEAERA